MRGRAATLGNFNMGPQGLAWILLNALNCSPQEWNELRMHFRGHLPGTEQQFSELVEYIRRYGHVLEKGPMSMNGIRGGGNRDKGNNKGKGHYFYPTFDFGGGSSGSQDHQVGFGTGAGMTAGASYPASGDPAAGWAPTHDWTSPPSPPDPWSAYLEGGGTGGQEDNDTDTDEDDGEDLDGSDFPGQVGQDDDVIQQYLYQSYVFHKKRWRRFTGRPTRYSRFGKSKGKGSLIPPRDAFGGKSSGK